MTMTALWRSSCGGCGFGALLQGLDRHAGGDRAAGEDVCSEATAVDESPEGAGLGETLKVSAGLAETLTETLDVADEEVAPDKTVEVDTAGDDVAAGVGVGEAAPVREHEFIEHLGLDEGQVVPSCGRGARAEGASLGGVPVAFESASGQCSRVRDEPHRCLRAVSDRHGLDHAAECGIGHDCRRGGVQTGHRVARNDVKARQGRPRQVRRPGAQHHPGGRSEHEHRAAAPCALGPDDGDPIAGPVERLRFRQLREPKAAARQPLAPLAHGLLQGARREGNMRCGDLHDRAQAGSEGPHRR